jgi:hypothetical protein
MLTFDRTLLLAPLLALLCTPARAESPRDAARRLLVEGNDLLNRGACAAALQRFQQAKAAYPSSYKVEVNLGTARECLGDAPAAAEHFEQFLKHADARALGDVVSGIEEKVAALRKKLGRLVVTCRLDGAELSIDGKSARTLPLDHDVYLAPGAHQVTVARQGFLRFDQRVSLAAGERKELLAVLAPVPAAATAPTAGPTPEPAAESDAPRSKPIYKRWWFWTVVGAVVVGAATAGIVASQTGGSDRLPSGKMGAISLELGVTR